MSPSWEPFGRVRDQTDAPASRMSAEPRRSLVVVTCMDARVDPLRGFGLRRGDAHVLRNAGAEATPDVLRSLRVSHAAAGTSEVWLVGHTDCVAHERSDERVERSLRRSLERVAAMDEPFRVRVFRYDLRADRMNELRF